MVTCSVMVGRSPRPVEPTLMVFTPVPGMAKFMVSAPEVKLASSIAALSEHEPPNPQKPSPIIVSWKSPVEVTVKIVEARAGPAAIVLAIIIAAMSSSPTASIFDFVAHSDARSLVWVLIFPFSFLAALVRVIGLRFVRLKGL
jgi:hypothetical protein